MHRSGQLAAANSDFIGLTLETRPDAELASRAASFLRMAKKHEMPLIALRESEEGRRAISETMTREKVRSDGRQMDIVSLTSLGLRTSPPPQSSVEAPPCAVRSVGPTRRSIYGSVHTCLLPTPTTGTHAVAEDRGRVRTLLGNEDTAGTWLNSRFGFMAWFADQHEALADGHPA